MPKIRALTDFININQEDWKKEWQGMPEFIQDDLSPYKSIIVHFASKKDMEEFSKLLKQSLTKKTKSIWYPKADIIRVCDKRYVDES